jgi:gamma-glutamylcyclotransferase (GGCT)/AIG2-like uncharacterized protein YtfP
MRKAVLEVFGTVYRDKQESLDHIDYLERSELPVIGIEVVKLTKKQADSNSNKIIWYKDPLDSYDAARTFVRKQMIGVWNYADFK